MLEKMLRTVLQEWSFWTTPPLTGLMREIALPAKLHPDIALLIQGVRRCGKSTLLTQLPQHYQLPLAQCYYCNFEDPRLLNVLDYELLSKIVEIARKDHAPSTPCYFFFDEIQHVQGWEKWIHVQLERPHHNHFIVTGSNSCLLGGEFGTALTGRHLTLELYPFSFSEYKALCPHHTVEDYLQSGGFPRPLTFEHPTQLLQEYFNDIILRDVLKRVHARTPEVIKQVAKMAYDTCGSELSYRKIAAVTGSTVDTIKTYLEACEQAYLLFSCPYFSFSEKTQQLRQKKYYPIDPGLRHAVSATMSHDKGKSLELLVYLRLRQRHERVFYWQEIHRGEVDFVTVDGTIVTPYQVTWEAPEERHKRALLYFYEAFPQAQEAVVITRHNAEDFI